MEKIIIKSMKKVFNEELKNLEEELNNILKKYEVRSVRELKEKLANSKIKVEETDLKRAEELEKYIERVMKCLREINIKAIK
ncbi:hypothetical protein J422_06461 [Methanocaldococcus villosus KIN24-T80]|uniref:Uncharacterized protein n=1 Tax=Methanocaldococcus villosus KIN24-T80 TaxID=1069083 RepID=N6VX67_9EURY|nr:hypothetical protein [Methanocaldococcus villosus]ENN95707.1 hypothetical protein J422_06461 [Methanocaldococcus villosus KIN24-T80]